MSKHLPTGHFSILKRFANSFRPTRGAPGQWPTEHQLFGQLSEAVPVARCHQGEETNALAPLQLSHKESQDLGLGNVY